MSNKIGSYRGYYNGNIIRSSYEYIYAKIMEKLDISYKTEAITYKLKDNEDQIYNYTPDFFLYDKANKLYKIVEIRGYRFNIEERILDINRLSRLKEIKSSKIECVIVTEKEIKNMCSKYQLDYNFLKKEWRESSNTKFNRNDGVFNSRYGATLTKETRKKISKKRQENIKKDPEKYTQIGYNLVKWCKERNYDFLRGERVPRYKLICPFCNKEFEVIQHKKDKTTFCSMSCLQKSNTIKAQKSNKNKGKSIREKRADVINHWIVQQKLEDLKNIPYNKITTSLYELINLLEKDFGVKDFRTIMISVGITSRKKFLDYMIDYNIKANKN